MPSELFIQQLKQYSDIEQIVSSYVPLKKKGRYLTGLCPFHSEKTPFLFRLPGVPVVLLLRLRRGGRRHHLYPRASRT